MLKKGVVFPFTLSKGGCGASHAVATCGQPNQGISNVVRRNHCPHPASTPIFRQKLLRVVTLQGGFFFRVFENGRRFQYSPSDMKWSFCARACITTPPRRWFSNGLSVILQKRGWKLRIFFQLMEDIYGLIRQLTCEKKFRQTICIPSTAVQLWECAKEVVFTLDKKFHNRNTNDRWLAIMGIIRIGKPSLHSKKTNFL